MKVKVKKEVEVEITTLYVRAGVRYWEDGKVNGVEDENGDLIPCRVEDDWCLTIDLENGKVMNWKHGITADVHYKVCDDGTYILADENNEQVLCKEGYVPSCLAIDSQGYGDYIIIKIDELGFINNWEFTENDLEDFIEDED